MGLVVFVLVVNSQPDLQIWHSTELWEEFTADSGVEDFAGYLEVEESVYSELRESIIEKLPSEGHQRLNRFREGSLSDPARFARDWNRTFVLQQERPKAAVLLLHGMSDSPYSLRNIGLELHAWGAYVIGLRLPGHGTAPVGLTMARWQDMAAAVVLAMTELEERSGGAPLHVIGYSNGGALAVNYALDALGEPDRPQPAGITLISPAISVTPAAAFAVWQERIGWILGLDKLKWTSVIPEYDPFKYMSFAVHAGDQVHRLASRLSARITAREREGTLDRLPPLRVFVSIVDATVSSPAVFGGLLDRLPEGGHEVFLFDINRAAGVDELLTSDPAPLMETALGGPTRSYAVNVISNAAIGGREGSEQVWLRRREAGEAAVSETPLAMRWPPDIYSLSHVAIAMPPSDPLYGDGRTPDPWGEQSPLSLGDVKVRGERNVLAVSPAELSRQRWNPFYDLVRDRILEFIRPR